MSRSHQDLERRRRVEAMARTVGCSFTDLCPFVYASLYSLCPKTKPGPSFRETRRKKAKVTVSGFLISFFHVAVLSFLSSSTHLYTYTSIYRDGRRRPYTPERIYFYVYTRYLDTGIGDNLAPWNGEDRAGVVSTHGLSGLIRSLSAYFHLPGKRRQRGRASEETPPRLTKDHGHPLERSSRKQTFTVLVDLLLVPCSDLLRGSYVSL